MSASLDKPVAIVTGAGKGIGRATAIELTKAGYALLLTARTQGDLEETIALAGGGIAVAGDVTDVGDVDRVIAAANDRFGRIDAVINNAGFAPPALIDDITIEQWQKTIETNLSAAFYFCRAVWPTFRKQKGGVIVNISSLSARDPFDSLFAYGAAKAGLNLLGLGLARQGAAHNIRVHTLALGAVETGMFRELMTPEQFPTSKTLDPAEVARVIAQCVRGELQSTSGEVIYFHKGAR